MNCKFRGSRSPCSVIVVVLMLMSAASVSHSKRLGSPDDNDEAKHQRELFVFKNGPARQNRGPVNTVVTGVGNAVNTVANGVGNAVSATGNGVGNAVSTLGNGVGNAMGAVGDGIGGAVSAVGNVAGNVADTVGDGIDTTVDAVSNLAGNAVSFTGNGIDTTVSTLGNGIGGAVGTVGDGIGGAVTAVGNGVGNTLPGPIGDAVDAVATGVGNAVSATGNGVGNAMSTTANGIGGIVSTVGDGVGGAVSNVGDISGNVANTLVSGTGGAVDAVANAAGNAVSFTGNGIGDVVGTLGNGVDGAVSAVGNGIGGAINAVGDGIGNIGANAAQRGAFDDGFSALDGLIGIGQRCGLGGDRCPGDLECQRGGPLGGLCLPVRCITDNIAKHAAYLQRMLDVDTNGGGIEYAKNYTRNNPEERDEVGNDFSACFAAVDDDEGDINSNNTDTNSTRRERSLQSARFNTTHAVGAIGDISLVVSTTGYYMYVLPETTSDNQGGNVLGFCGGAGVGGGFSLQPMYDMTFAETLADTTGSWTFARFEAKIPVPPLTFGFGVHVGIQGDGGILGAINPIGSPPKFALRITAILPFIGGAGANFFNVARCRAMNLG